VGFEASNFTQVPLQSSCADSGLKPRPLSNKLSVKVAQSWLLANGHIYRPGKELHCQKWRHYVSRKLFSKPFVQKGEEKWPNPVLTMGFLPLARPW